MPQPAKRSRRCITNPTKRTQYLKTLNLILTQACSGSRVVLRLEEVVIRKVNMDKMRGQLSLDCCPVIELILCQDEGDVEYDVDVNLLSVKCTFAACR